VVRDSPKVLHLKDEELISLLKYVGIENRVGTKLCASQTTQYVNSMSRIEEAIGHFAAALERLEKSIHARNPGAVPLPAMSNEVRAEVDKLKAERALLAEEVETLRSENERLASLAGEASRQLDGAVEDMRGVLKRAS